jgi:hypothetical protein
MFMECKKLRDVKQMFVMTYINKAKILLLQPQQTTKKAGSGDSFKDIVGM